MADSPEGRAPTAAGVSGRGGFWLATGAAATTWVALIAFIQARNPRVRVSWHGFLHAAIMNRFPSASLPPENPFYAGEPLPYYWFHHAVAAAVGALLDVDPIRALQIVVLSSLVALVFAAAWIGRKRFRSTAAGLLIGLFVLAGANPFGPGIALAKYLATGRVLFDGAAADGPQVFVSDLQSDRWMTQPLLPAMYYHEDWRLGQNLVWFLDGSSRGPALAALVVLLCLLVAAPRNGRTLAATVAATAFATALNPLIGIGAGGSLAVAVSLFSLASPRRGVSTNAESARAEHVEARQVAPVSSPPEGGDQKEEARRSRGASYGEPLTILAGIVLALPTYCHLLLLPGTAALTPADRLLPKATALAVIFAPLGLLAVAGSRGDRRLTSCTAAGVVLLLAALFVRLEEGNEHNLANAAACLLAVPAAGWIARAPRAAGGVSALLFVLFLPAAACTLLSFTGRPDLPLGTRGSVLVRLPESDPLQRLYDWIRANTEPDAVFVTRPDAPVKMSGNVAELPAFTSRTLFVDQPTYLNRPYDDLAFRGALALKMSRGGAPEPFEARYLRELRRPIYVVSYEAGETHVLETFAAAYGRPVFHSGPIAVFRLSLRPWSIRPDERNFSP